MEENKNNNEKEFFEAEFEIVLKDKENMNDKIQELIEKRNLIINKNTSERI